MLLAALALPLLSGAIQTDDPIRTNNGGYVPVVEVKPPTGGGFRPLTKHDLILGSGEKMLANGYAKYKIWVKYAEDKLPSGEWDWKVAPASKFELKPTKNWYENLPAQGLVWRLDGDDVDTGKEVRSGRAVTFEEDLPGDVVRIEIVWVGDSTGPGAAGRSDFLELATKR